MEDDEVEQLMVELRAMLLETGFGWIVDQAVEALPRTSSNRTVALALIDAVEAVTVELAQAELETIQLLEVDEIVFKPDPNPNSDEGDDGQVGELEARRELDDKDAIRGEQRRSMLDDMLVHAQTFEELRSRLNGLV